MKIVVLDADTLGTDLDLSVLNTLGEMTVFRRSSAEEVPQRLSDAEIVLLNKIRIDEAMLQYAPKLRLICVAATGFDNVDLSACRNRNIAVCNVKGYSTQSVVQVTFAMALSLSCKLDAYTDYVKSGDYARSGRFSAVEPVFHELYGKTWGIVGFGNIGEQVGKVARAMGCRVLVNKRTAIAGWDCVSLEQICRESDIISLHCPLMEQTYHLIDGEHLDMMKPNVMLLNMARGNVVDEEAAANAILNRKIGSLGVDVYSQEPFSKEHPYFKICNMKNVCMTPHMAWGSYEARETLLNEICQNIISFGKGERKNRVD